MRALGLVILPNVTLADHSQLAQQLLPFAHLGRETGLDGLDSPPGTARVASDEAVDMLGPVRLIWQEEEGYARETVFSF